MGPGKNAPGGMMISHLLDLQEKCRSRNVIQTSDFLTPEERAEAERRHINAFFFGGFRDAERTCAVFLPDYISEEDVTSDPSIAGIGGVKISLSAYDSDGKTGHRDVLGALMNLGIRREVTGDIVCRGNVSYFVARTKIIPHIIENLTRVGRYAVRLEEIPCAEIVPHDDGTPTKKSVSSLRLDAVLSACFNISRDRAREAIAGGEVFVDGREALKPDGKISAGQRISFRGRGRAEITSAVEKTQKGRTLLEFTLYR